MTNGELNRLLWGFGAFLFGVVGFFVRSDVYGMYGGLIIYGLLTVLVFAVRFWRTWLRFISTQKSAKGLLLIIVWGALFILLIWPPESIKQAMNAPASTGTVLVLAFLTWWNFPNGS